MLSLFVIISLLQAPANRTVADIPLPQGYTRVAQPANSFGARLRKVPLKQDNTVYLYDGRKKGNQSAQYAVLDVSVGKKDLQQCADAVIRLYAEYLYTSQQYERIAFRATDGTVMDYASWKQGYRFVLQGNRLAKRKSAAACDTRACFDQYLEIVFSYAGTLSLSKELKPAGEVRAGDVFIQGGSPGHAVIVMDVAENQQGDRLYLLAQSYMPAQHIHILRNTVQSPWYGTSPEEVLRTPEWTFPAKSLKRFQ